MASKEFTLIPQDVPLIKTGYRSIQTKFPVPESVPILKKLRDLEPRSMGGQPPVLWDHGENFMVCDAYGNRWLDFSSGVLVTSSGHGRKRIIDAISEMAGGGLYHAYCFPTEIRLRLIEEITTQLPSPLTRVFLLTTGSEATECCIKLARTRGLAVGGKKKKVFVTFTNAFHGRTLGAQLAGGSPDLKKWAGEDTSFVQVPYPDGFRQRNVGFDVFVRSLEEQGVSPGEVCGVMSETYQGCNAVIMPAEYAQALREWCDRWRAVLIFDEIQAGFGRTGKPFGFSHLGVVPDLAACGKGISGGMPLSAVLGTEELMGMYGPGEMTSTHSANPVCCAAALANLTILREERLVANAADLAPLLAKGTASIAAASSGKVGFWASTGMVSAIQFTQPGTTEADPETAWGLVNRAVQRGLLLFAPVGVGGCAVKINPPLTITEDALGEGLQVLEEAIAEVCMN